MAFDGTLKFDTAIDQSGFEKGLSSLGGLAKKGMAAVAGAITAASGAMAALGTKSLEAYADYEQLTGGIATLFGAQDMSIEEYAQSVGKSVDTVRSEYESMIAAQNDVMNNAAAAFRTAGLSQNEYMETVTSFSAALISSLDGDTAKAAEIADRAIVDMSDNANKMGSSMESIQNAYQGFAKQNYTMLDNLKLGYGGTKSEMERLLADAQAISGIEYNIENYADVVEAIHVIQSEMHISGITAEEAAELVASGALTEEEAFARMGTTAKEASTTIQGSLGAAKAAFSNLLVGIADDEQDFEKLVDDLVSSTATAAENILPRVETIIGGAGKMISSLSGVAADMIVSLAGYLPDLISAGSELIGAVADGLTQNTPAIASAVLDAGLVLVDGIISVVPDLVSAAAQCITQLVRGFTANAPKLHESARTMITEIVTSLTSNTDELLTAALELVTVLAEELVNDLPVLVEAALTLISSIAEFIGSHAEDIIDAALKILTLLAGMLIQNAPELLSAVVQIGAELLKAIADGASQLLSYAASWWSETAGNALDSLAEWLDSMIGSAVQGAKDFVDGAMEFLEKLPELLGEMLGNAIAAVARWAADMVSSAKNTAESFLNSVRDFFSRLPETAKRWLDNTVSRVADWARNLKEKGKSAAKDLVDSVVNGIASLPEKMLDAGKNLVQGLWNGITGAANWLKDKISEFGQGIINGFKSAFGIASPSKVMRDSVGRYIAEGVGVGFMEEIPEVGADVVKAFSGIRLKAPEMPEFTLRNPVIDSAAFSAVRRARTESAFSPPAAASEAVNNYSSYIDTAAAAQPESVQEIAINARFQVGEEVVAEGVKTILFDGSDKYQGIEVQMRKRGLAT